MDLQQRLEAVNKARKAAIDNPVFRESAKEHENTIVQKRKQKPKTKRRKRFSEIFRGVENENRKGLPE